MSREVEDLNPRLLRARDAYLDRPTSVAVSQRFAARRLPAVLEMDILFWMGVILGLIGLLIGSVWV